MAPKDDAVAVAVLVDRVDNLTNALNGLKEEFQTFRTMMTPQSNGGQTWLDHRIDEKITLAASGTLLRLLGASFGGGVVGSSIFAIVFAIFKGWSS